MRQALITELINQAEHDSSIVLLTGDLGYSVLEPFQQRFPDRFFNVGVAEQNMVSMAAGMSKMGMKVVVYSIGNFLAFRALEQIRNDVYYQNHHVLLVGAGCGYEYGAAGFTHWMTEDLAALSSLENLHIYTPTNEASLVKCVRDWTDGGLPAYLRLSKKSIERAAVNDVWVSGDSFEAFLSYGHTAVDLIEEHKPTVVFERLAPLDPEAISRILRGFDRLTVTEEHVWYGGLACRLLRVLNGRFTIGWNGVKQVGKV